MLLLLFAAFALAAGLHVNMEADTFIVPPAQLNPSPYADWAHSHWVWLSARDSNRTSSENLVAEYLRHNITVGAIDLDSGWSTGFNNFKFDETIYPDPKGMIEGFHAKGVRVILWATSMIDTDSDNYQEAESNNYFLKDVLNKEQHPIKWWHGKGGLIDYSEPHALYWWHQQMNRALDLNIDGWKCDGTDPYMLELGFARGYDGRHITYREYADSYYGDFFSYTQERLGNDRLIMSRPVDSYGPVFLSFSPKDVMFSGWVGDLDPTWKGLLIGLERMRASAERGYLNFGTDIGGYRGCGGAVCRERELFIRWFQLGAFCPLMENGGNNDHTPWAYDSHYGPPGSTVITDTYRTFVNTHYALGPYFLSIGTQRYLQRRSTLDFSKVHTHDFSYLLGDNIFVAPFIQNGTNMEIKFPGLTTEVWVSWWNHSQIFTGGSSVNYQCSYESFPVFQLSGTIVPLAASYAPPSLTHASPHCVRNSSADIIAKIIFPADGQGSVTFDLHEFNDTGIYLSYTLENDAMILTASAHTRRVTFVVLRTPSTPRVSSVNGAVREREGECGDETTAWWSASEDSFVLHSGSNTDGSLFALNF